MLNNAEERCGLLEDEDDGDVTESVPERGPVGSVGPPRVIDSAAKPVITDGRPKSPPHPPSDGVTSPVSKWSIVSVVILTFINLLNYMDRYSIAGQSISELLLRHRLL